MKNGHRYLKVKIKSLAEEARIIRKEEFKSKGQLQFGLYLHRIGKVRSEARHTQLAYGFLRGRKYSQLEKTSKYINVTKIISMIEKYGPCHDWENKETNADFQTRKIRVQNAFRDWINNKL
jgi:hypothetical protein